MSTLPIQFQSATEQLGLLRERKVGARELLDIHIAQLERHDEAINAVVVRDLDAARAAARAADNAPLSDRGSLHGLPMTVKECFEVAGLAATCGLPDLAPHVAPVDADAVASLRNAGAVIFGKTNLPPGAFDWQAYNPIYGVTNNPWDLTRSPGGSSGGSAAALAAGFTPLELGSDIGGSIRVPAHFCGVFGHKPSWGIIPSRGHIPPPPGVDVRVELAVCGPLARSARDLELAMDILVAPPQQDRHAWSITLPAARHERLQDFRVGIYTDTAAYPTDAAYVSAIEAFADDLRGLGVTVDEQVCPDIDLAAAYETYLTTLLGLVGSGIPRDAIEPVLAAWSAMHPQSYPARAARATRLRHYEYGDVAQQRDQLRRAWREFFGHYDVLLAPIFPTVAYKHDHRGDETGNPLEAYEHRSRTVNSEEQPYFDGLQWASFATAPDLPAIAMPTGRLIDGLPAGVQIIGPALEDRTPIRFAELAERELGGFTIPPDLT